MNGVETVFCVGRDSSKTLKLEFSIADTRGRQLAALKRRTGEGLELPLAFFYDDLKPQANCPKVDSRAGHSS